MLSLVYDKRKNDFFSDDPQTITALRKSCYGYMDEGKIRLTPIETMYLCEMRNAIIKDNNMNIISINKLISLCQSMPRFITKYFVYRDWRERGMSITEKLVDELSGHMLEVVYPTKQFSLNINTINGRFFNDELTTLVDDSQLGKELYEKYWFGQYGTYKQPERGKFLKLDCYETRYLLEKGILSKKDIKIESVIKEMKNKLLHSDMLYEVYSDWRELGYVVKTGFKFGTHFRIYFPGAKPGELTSEYAHSKHVIHVFPRSSPLVIAEWSRAIRVAHSVKKTFIFAIPGNKKKKTNNIKIDFYAQSRKSESITNTNNKQKTYALFCMHEDNVISGDVFASIIENARTHGMDLLFAVVDRETSVTYYIVKQIKLEGSKFDYYELEWIQP